jgi:hypothetical protein
MAEYYDVVLGAIPISLVIITGALTVAGLSLTVAVPLGAVVSVGLIGHAMFVRGPVDAERNPPEPAAANPREAADEPATDDAASATEEPGVGTRTVAP